MSNQTMNYDFDRLIEEARMHRTAAIGNAIVSVMTGIGSGVKSIFDFGSGKADVSKQQTRELQTH